MELPGSQPQWPACGGVGKYFRRLLNDQSWVRRRVETVEVTSTISTERRVSLDIDVSRLVNIAKECNIEDTKYLYFPLTLLTKRLLIDFDVTDESGRSLSLATSDEDSYAAQALLLASLDAADMDPAKFSPHVMKKMYDIVKDEPLRQDARTIANISRLQQNTGILGWQLQNPTAADRQLWGELFKQREYLLRVTEFTTQYMPIVRIDTSESLRIIKYSTMESEWTWSRRGMRFRERIGWSPAYFGFNAPSLGRAQRDHFRVCAPRDSFVTAAVVRSVTGGPGPLEPADSGENFIGRITPGRALVYTQNRKSSGPSQVVVGLRPTTRGFITPAFWGPLISAVLLALGAIGQRVFGVLDTIKDNSAEPAVALLVVVPSVLAAYLARDDEHQVRSVLLMVPRHLVAGTSALTFVAAISIIARFSGPTLFNIWTVCGALCFAIFCFLATICLRIEHHMDRVMRDSLSQKSSPIKKW